MGKTRDLNETTALRPGLLIGGYRLLENIGRGGQGAVWAAWSAREQRVYAIKQVYRQEGSDLRQEFQLAEQLDHPRIVRPRALERADDSEFVVMDYFPFGSLELLVESGELQLLQILQVCRDISAALAYTHSHSIVHRDLKPRNILIDGHGHAYLTDFGIARSLSTETNAFHTGQGTAVYSSPEQHNLSQITPRADLYSLGIMIFEMLTGELPWRGQSSLAMMQVSHNMELPDPRTLNPALPEGLVEILRNFTALDPDARPESADEAWEMIYDCFAPQLLGVELISPEQPYAYMADAERLAESELKGWVAGGEFATTISDFAMIHALYAGRLHAGQAPDWPDYGYLLHGSLRCDFERELWWKAPVGVETRMAACEQILAREDGSTSQMLLEAMLSDPELLPRAETLSPYVISGIAQYLNGANAAQAVGLLERLCPAASTWSMQGISPVADLELAALAASESPHRGAAARLIGRIKSRVAFDYLSERGFREALQTVWREARSLPPEMPLPERLRLTIDLIGGALRPSLGELWPTLWPSVLGAAVALTLYVFVSYRWVSLLDSTRLLNALGAGLIFGPLTALGLVAARILPGRLRPLPGFSVFVLSFVISMPLLLGSLMAFHLLFLGIVPAGWSFYLAAGLLSALFLGLEMSAWPPLLRAAAETALGGAALAASWQAYQRWGLSPLLYFESGWSVATLSSMLLVAVLMLGLPALASRAGR